MSELIIKKATRQGVKPLVGIYAESGCGKTYTSLLLARGFVGPTGKIVLADTESGRGSLYADVLPGGYDVLDVTGPFSPERGISIIQLVESSGAAIGILDSGSHFWEGIGGVLDMAAANEGRSERAGLHNWRTPKMEHQKFMLRLLQSSIPWIICLRAKYKSRQIKGTKEMADSGEIGKHQVGKTIILKDQFTTPIQSEDFIFEMTAHGEIMPDHSLRLTKCSHPSLKACFPDGKPVTIQHGELLAKWCASPGGSASSAPVGRSVATLKKELVALTQSIHTGDMARLQQHCWDEGWIDDTENLSGLDEKRLGQVIELAKKGTK